MEPQKKISVELEARKFLQERVAALRRDKLDYALSRLKEDILHIFTGRYDRLKKDRRFVQLFLNKKIDLHGDQSTLGETLVSAFSLIDRFYTEELPEKGKDPGRTEEAGGPRPAVETGSGEALFVRAGLLTLTR